ncbi:uncharacterized protein LACBIDRAFT_303598 [Laccaria bicolor S238N-H82]|uniref:Predicted protein n=1 Tax=Laccaria bicolor (strain S238N-H82 / ATCC MYA-4686) TaxID=486041 RepID=B0DJT7_LACBS|nr:uncharacterized protein LACBIDRAFT_303598 [Laccaria bicolor S238N-H82]EDR05266.1 predicted protein [Laccaria bicolor S238N-H82]|eukprot:XP_001884231.1 predicted protein [Laccaria bicolor S238N-H82]
MESRQLPLASSSAATLVRHPFTSSSTTLGRSSTDDVSTQEGLYADFDDPDQSSELPSRPTADACDASSSFKPDKVDRLSFPLRVVGRSLAFRRLQKAGEELPRCLKLLQSTHADAQVDLEEAERLRKKREKVVQSTLEYFSKMRSKIDMAIGGERSLPDGGKGGKGKGRSQDDFSLLSRLKTESHSSTHPGV